MSDQRLGLRAAREPNSSSRQLVAGGGEEGWLLPPCQWKVGDSIDHGVKSDNEWGEEQCWSGHRERMLIATVDAIACRPRHSLFPTVLERIQYLYFIIFWLKKSKIWKKEWKLIGNIGSSKLNSPLSFFLFSLLSSFPFPFSFSLFFFCIIAPPAPKICRSKNNSSSRVVEGGDGWFRDFEIRRYFEISRFRD